MNEDTEKNSENLMAIDIADIVKGVQEETPPVEECSTPPSLSPEDPETASPQWEYFLHHLQTFKQRRNNSENRKRPFYIEDNIIEVISSCEFDGSTATNIINSALLAFINEHKENFRSHLKPSPSLIQ